jgi:hypothetical protein
MIGVIKTWIHLYKEKNKTKQKKKKKGNLNCTDADETTAPTSTRRLSKKNLPSSSKSLHSLSLVR